MSGGGPPFERRAMDLVAARRARLAVAGARRCRGWRLCGRFGRGGAGGERLEGLEVTRPTLEEVYLELTREAGAE